MTETTNPAPSIEEQIEALQRQQAALKARKVVCEQLAGATPAEKDEGLIRVLGVALEQRLAQARAAGRSGWWSDECTDEQLVERLQAQIASGQYLDAAAYAAMLHARQHLA